MSYTNITEILSDLIENKISMRQFVTYARKFPEEIHQKTKFLDKCENISIIERLYYIVNKISSPVKCKYCDNKATFYGTTIKAGYRPTCSCKECKSKELSNTHVKPGETKSSRLQAFVEKQNSITEVNDDIIKDLCKYDSYVQHITNQIVLSYINSRFEDSSSILESVQRIKLSIEEKPKCPTCNKPVQWIGKTSKLYTKYCSNSCRSQNKDWQSITVWKFVENRDNDILQHISGFNCSLVKYLDKSTLLAKCNVCGSDITITRARLCFLHRKNWDGICDVCYPHTRFRSAKEIELYEEIKKLTEILNLTIEHNIKIGKYEADILIPEKKLCIEFNGVYYHSEFFCDKNYHMDNKKYFFEKGYDLIYVWEDDWEFKKDIVINRIKAKLGLCSKIRAHKCEIKELNYKNAKEFLDDNHLQGGGPTAKYYVGLYYQDKLIELITIGKSRKLIAGNEDALELIRLCTKGGYIVYGGFTKLLQYVISKYNVKNLISYADLSWISLSGNSYKNVGFELVSETPPDYWWAKGIQRENRLYFTKNSLVTQGFDKNKTEVEIMHERKYFRVFGPGNLKFKLIPKIKED